MNVETYACDFLRFRGYRAGRDYDANTCVSVAARVLTEEDGMKIKMQDLRATAAMAQFSEREVRPDVLRFIESNPQIRGDQWVSMDATSVKVLEGAR